MKVSTAEVSPMIRNERPDDIAAIHTVTRDAFLSAPHSSGTEQHIVDALRAAGALSISLVAEDAGGIIGHVALSPVQLSDGSTDWYGLGPISVAPHRQGEGIGSALMRAAIKALQARGAAGCVLLGDPGYYGRFGFRADPRLRLAGVPAEYFQALQLQGEWPDAEVSYHAGFGVTV
ncbi:N-acetyltransferase [Stenotrophomonas sp. ISL-67]|uniref:GNAT family N-acetyltransferase n=1 Tax=Stenotrophomonas sp. ISL-67 TaxID=2819171 RepID=UPI001BEB216B|nr:N-acetyltransferase [Stenotrophomonas sp. ISL-67]MBT2767725.1 N-acetyltransferase [Stenotrophomonas sp. ISL-67]